jgi:hypothetical protein
MQTKRIFQFIALFVVLTLLTAAIYYGASYFTGAGLDSVIKQYETSGNSEPIRTFLLKYDGEAENHEKAISFIGWGTTHQTQFIEITDGFAENDTVRVAQRLAFAVHDTGGQTQFEDAFKSYDSRLLRILRKELSRLKAIKVFGDGKN